MNSSSDWRIIVSIAIGREASIFERQRPTAGVISVTYQHINKYVIPSKGVIDLPLPEEQLALPVAE